MPIKPENRARYPKNWKEIRASILERAENKCEFCGIPNRVVKNVRTGEWTNDGDVMLDWTGNFIF